VRARADGIISGWRERRGGGPDSENVLERTAEKVGCEYVFGLSGYRMWNERYPDVDSAVLSAIITEHWIVTASAVSTWFFQQQPLHSTRLYILCGCAINYCLNFFFVQVELYCRIVRGIWWCKNVDLMLSSGRFREKARFFELIDIRDSTWPDFQPNEPTWTKWAVSLRSGLTTTPVNLNLCSYEFGKYWKLFHGLLPAPLLRILELAWFIRVKRSFPPFFSLRLLSLPRTPNNLEPSIS